MLLLYIGLYVVGLLLGLAAKIVLDVQVRRPGFRQGVGLVREIKPAGQIVHELVEEARQIIAQRLLGLVQPA